MAGDEGLLAIPPNSLVSSTNLGVDHHPSLVRDRRFAMTDLTPEELTLREGVGKFSPHW